MLSRLFEYLQFDHAHATDGVPCTSYVCLSFEPNKQRLVQPDLVLKSKTNVGKLTEDLGETAVCRICQDIAEDAIQSKCRHIFVSLL